MKNWKINITVNNVNRNEGEHTNSAVIEERNGTYTLQYKLPLLKTNNTQKINIIYSSKNYKRLDAHNQFKIQKINTTLTLKDTTIKKGKILHIKPQSKTYTTK